MQREYPHAPAEGEKCLLTFPLIGLPISVHNAAYCRFPHLFRLTGHPGTAGVRVLDNAVILFWVMQRGHQMTRADLTEEIYQAIGTPLKESDLFFCAIFDRIIGNEKAVLPRRRGKPALISKL
jgi:hypothetical protein